MQAQAKLSVSHNLCNKNRIPFFKIKNKKPVKSSKRMLEFLNI